MRFKLSPTPIVYDDFLGCYLKLECENPSGSHKDRETLYLLNKFGKDKKYIIASSGNAGISLAYWMKGKATVVVPEITPKEKIKAIEKHGAKVIVKGKYFYESYKFAEKIAEKEGLINLSPGFVDRWHGDVEISYELKSLMADFIFVPSADLTLAYGIAYGFNEMIEKEMIKNPPVVVACVLPNHPLIRICRDEEIKEEYKSAFNSIYTHGEEGENIETKFLDFPFTKIDSTRELGAVLELGKKYPSYDPAVLLALYISKKYDGKKVVIATGVSRS
ncbi:hypothetical protein DRO54_01025 [Candidatus Bathyarchaeota archaeon]|nr:MAG: hypothetical protein DRO54_01025 [Candidatus Bathyarchaeota archaeon]